NDDLAARSRDAKHLVEHRVRIRDVVERLEGDSDVERSVREWKRRRVSHPSDPPEGIELRLGERDRCRRNVDGGNACTALCEVARKSPARAAEVEHLSAVERWKKAFCGLAPPGQRQRGCTVELDLLLLAMPVI